MKSEKFKDGSWTQWNGGECPVPKGTMIDVRYRDGYIEENIPTMESPVDDGRTAESWDHLGSEADIVFYRLSQQEDEVSFPKQERYKDREGDDYIDECAASFTPEEFRGAMKYTVGKYNRRVGKKDDELEEVIKMQDYCNRWRQYLEAQRDAE